MPDILIDVTDAIMTITFNRPARLNALTHDMHDMLVEAIDRADQDSDVGAVIVTGEGRGFCAGTDLAAGGFSRLANPELAPQDIRDAPRDKGGTVVLRLFECRKPLIAAVNGVAVGMGAGLTLAMDIRIGTPDTRYLFPYTRRGIVAESCSSWFLPRLVGIDHALDWMMSGRQIFADEAKAAGLLTQVVDAGALIETARARAHTYIQGASGLSMALTRRMLWHGLVAPHPMDGHRQESRALVVMSQSGDPGEGAQAFVDKRSPVFPGTIETHYGAGLPEWVAPAYLASDDAK